MNAWDEVVNAERGKKFLDKFDEGVRFVILRGGASLCGYVGVPADHPLAGFDYESIPIEAHGGLTYGGDGDGKWLPVGWYWYGWDYAHCGDFCVYDVKYGPTHGSDKRWTAEDVEKDAWDAIWSTKKLMKLAETIANKAYAKAGGAVTR